MDAINLLVDGGLGWDGDRVLAAEPLVALDLALENVSTKLEATRMTNLGERLV